MNQQPDKEIHRERSGIKEFLYLGSLGPSTVGAA